MISERFVLVFRVQVASRREHNGGVQVTDDARDRRGSVDAGLGAPRAGLEGGENTGHFLGDSTGAVSDNSERGGNSGSE